MYQYSFEEDFMNKIGIYKEKGEGWKLASNNFIEITTHAFIKKLEKKNKKKTKK